MAMIHWSDKLTHKNYNNEPYRVDIHDWRLIREGRIYLERFKRKEYGVFISVNQHIRFLPHATIDDIIYLNEKGRDVSIEWFHVGVRGTKHCITYCMKCHGAGKFDWIQKITPERRPTIDQGHRIFERDESLYFMYPGCDTLLFSKVKLNPGEEYCTLCQGLGLEVDGRHTLYKGMKGIKQKLFPVDSQEYNDKLKLKGLLK